MICSSLIWAENDQDGNWERFWHEAALFDRISKAHNMTEGWQAYAKQ
jgi:hypothetical protein